MMGSGWFFLMVSEFLAFHPSPCPLPPEERVPEKNREWARIRNKRKIFSHRGAEDTE